MMSRTSCAYLGYPMQVRRDPAHLYHAINKEVACYEKLHWVRCQQIEITGLIVVAPIYLTVLLLPVERRNHF